MSSPVSPPLPAITDDPADVRGIIYCIEHTATGKKYVGQTRSHRLNHKRYRPYGADARFRSHISEAMCNTKHKSGHLLGIDIRKFGAASFKCTILEECQVDELNDKECYWIAELGTLYPGGYNLTGGGTDIAPPALVDPGSAPPIIPNPTPLNAPRKRGGCTSRSEATRAKMSERAITQAATVEFRTARATGATAQHAAAKLARFADVKVDHANLDQYIYTKGKTIFIRVGEHEASFSGKTNTKEDNIKRAKEFLLGLTSVSDASDNSITHIPDETPIATLPNCSGNP
jgi:group I intron endonuclease